MSSVAAYQFNSFNRLIHKIGSSSLGARLFAHLQHRFDAIFFKATIGKTTLTSILSGLPIIVLTTIGARSGQPRTVPLVFLHDPATPENLGIIASNWGGQRNPGWYYNLRANPTTWGNIKGRQAEYLAQVATESEYERIWAEATALYPGFALYKERAHHRHIPIMILRPQSG